MALSAAWAPSTGVAAEARSASTSEAATRRTLAACCSDNPIRRTRCDACRQAVGRQVRPGERGAFRRSESGDQRLRERLVHAGFGRRSLPAISGLPGPRGEAVQPVEQPPIEPSEQGPLVRRRLAVAREGIQHDFVDQFAPRSGRRLRSLARPSPPAPRRRRSRGRAVRARCGRRGGPGRPAAPAPARASARAAVPDALPDATRDRGAGRRGGVALGGRAHRGPYAAKASSEFRFLSAVSTAPARRRGRATR